jgi:hypothetical protein
MSLLDKAPNLYSKIAVAEARGQFGNLKECLRRPFEIDARRMARLQQTEKTKYML